MPSSIENRVVQMTFDNAAFEKKLSDTITSIDKLEKSLEFEKSKKSLQEFSAQANKFNLGDISTHVEGVSKKFLAMSTIGITALANITNAAIKAGSQIVKSLSLDLVLDGFHEYETNISSIQTILANTSAKGTGLNDVTKALDQLNTFADKTIYNFGQMTHNIGTFTAAGVDLDTSVKSIKGIANLAAVSGSSADQAASAMYQLSQAIASGTLKLIDWNSVVNAGLGGEVFQKALFESGKALKTIKDVPMTETFDQWKKAGNSFRDSLQDGWITADVLTTTLAGFTGDLTDAQLAAKGFTKEQITQIQAFGKTAVDAATKVRTLTQLISTVKEAIGSGWSSSFRIIFGDFNEATELFTDVSNAIGKMVNNTDQARNKVLQAWKDMGGRIVLIEGLKESFKTLGAILKPLKDAFHDVFPPITGKRLFELTKGFATLARALHPSKKTVDEIRHTFDGLFQTFRIGIEIAKGIISVFKALVFKSQILSVLQLGDKFGNLMSRIRLILIEGGKIKSFFKLLTDVINNPSRVLDDLKQRFKDTFDAIRDTILNPIPFLEKLKNKIVEFIQNLTGGIPGLKKISAFELPGSGLLEGVLDRLKQRFDELKKAAQFFADTWDAVKERFKGVADILKGVFDYIVTWFKELGQKLAKEMKPGDFNAAVDALNVGLLGGIVLLLKKFLDGGLKIDFGGGLMKKIAGAVDQLTGVLKAMQTNLKADALLKIAAAIAILTGSLVVLSLIDSVALTKALTAMAVSFGQLIAVMAAMNKLDTGLTGNAGFTVMAAGLILISTAMLIFAAAVKVFATMNWEQLGRGLAGISAGLAIMVGAVKLLGDNSITIVAAGAAMIEMATALNILGGAMLIFATLSWQDIGKGLTVIAAGLTAIGLALSLVPATAPLVGAGFLIVANALAILGGAMVIFGTLDWGQIAKGLVIMAGALTIIGIALSAIPVSAPLTAAGILIAASALVVLAGAMKLFASIKGGDIGKSLAAMGGALSILAVGLTAMLFALPGAVALGVAAASLGILFKVIKAFADIKFGDLLRGLGGMALVLTALAIAAVAMAPLVPELLALGAAMTLIGGAFALFGVGALATAKAIEILAKSGKAGMDAVFGFMDGLIKRFPQLVTAVATSILGIGTTLLEGADPLVRALGVLLGHIIDKLTELFPKIVVFIEHLIDSVAQIIHDKSGVLVNAGLELLTNILKGIRDHIRDLTDIVGDIIINFINGLQDKIPDIIQAGVDLITAYIRGISQGIGQIVAAGAEAVVKFIEGLASKIVDISAAGANMIVAFIKGVSDNIVKMVDAVGDLVAAFIDALGNNIQKIIEAGGNLVVSFITGIANNIQKVGDAAANIFVAFMAGLALRVGLVVAVGAEIIANMIRGMGQNLSKISDAAANTVIKFIDGIGKNTRKIIDAGTNVVILFLQGFGKNSIKVIDATGQLIVDVLDGIARAINKYSPQIRKEGLKIALAILDGVTGGLAGKAARFLGGIVNIFKDAKDAVMKEIDAHSPSKVYQKIGEFMIAGVVTAFDKDVSMSDSAESLSNRTTDAFKSAIKNVASSVSVMDEFNPTITPVLDLSQIQKDSKRISGFFATPDLTPTITTAAAISTSTQANAESTASQATPVVPQPTEIKFEQNIHAPTQLSTADIYRQTRNQIALAKEELKIP